jgi:hypothetical protein
MRPRVKRLAAPSGAVFLACAPKCAMCALGYAGLFGLGGAELCGGPAATWPAWLPVIAGAAATATFLWLNHRRRRLSVRA